MATNEEFLSTIKEGCIQGWQSHAVLASISGAQAILESNWGKSTLALQANNLFGIKGDYNGASFTIETKEFINGTTKYVTAAFRKYPSWADSIADHSAFFTSTEFRKTNYAAVLGETDYKKAAQALSDAGYATDPDYPAKLIKLIETYDLATWDEQEEENEMPSITQNHTTVNYSAQNGAKKYIVWHDTGVKGQTAAGNANYFKSVDRQASAHYFVDKTSIYEVVAPNLVAWHCGDGNGAYGITNANSIGIELCPEADGSIHAQTLANALWLGKKLMSDFGISYDNNVRHYDASRKNCPQYLNTDGKWTKWYAFKAQLSGTVSAPVAATSGNLVYVDYKATIMRGGYSVDSKPWGEPGFETWSHSDDWLFKTIHFREETADGAYANGDYFGWVDKKALGPERKSVDYKATVIADWYSVDSLPWGEAGYQQLGTTANHINSVVTVRLESLTGEYAYILDDEKEIGWVDKRALVEGILTPPETEKEPVVVKSVLHLPNGHEWVIYPENGPYEVGDVVSITGVDGSWYTVLGDREGGKVVIDLQTYGRKAILVDKEKGATITQVLG